MAEVARIRAQKVLSGEAHPSRTLEGTVTEMMDNLLQRDPTAWSEVTRTVIRGVVEGLSRSQDAEAKLRGVSEAAVLAVARRWGNVISAGKATVVASREAASAHGMNSVRAAEQASLGAAEGVLRVGPIAFPVLQKELQPMVDNFDVIFQRSRNLPAVVEERPCIVDPFEPTPTAEGFDLEEDHAESSKEGALPLAPVASEQRLPAPPAQRPGLWARLWGWVRRLIGR